MAEGLYETKSHHISDTRIHAKVSEARACLRYARVRLRVAHDLLRHAPRDRRHGALGVLALFREDERRLSGHCWRHLCLRHRCLLVSLNLSRHLLPARFRAEPILRGF